MVERKDQDRYEEIMQKQNVINELREIVEKNNLSIEKIERGELQVERIEVYKANIEVKEKMVYLDRHIIEASDKARVTVLDREIKKINEQVHRRFKRDLEELEANVLAYQDLLICKDLTIGELEDDLNHGDRYDKKVLQEEIVHLKEVIETKISVIEDLRRQKRMDQCEEHDSDDELTKGTCTRSKLQRRVFKKIEHLNEYVRNEVTPEIHQKYAAEITEMKNSHFNEIDRLDREHKIMLHNHAQAYEAKIHQCSIDIQKLTDINRS